MTTLKDKIRDIIISSEQERHNGEYIPDDLEKLTEDIMEEIKTDLNNYLD